MSDLNELAEIADHLMYETTAVVIPGAALILAATVALQPEEWSQALSVFGDHPWLSVAACYVSGYFLQGVSRPICNLTEWALSMPANFGSWALGTVSAKANAALVARLAALSAWLRSGHTPPQNNLHERRINLEHLAQAHWSVRLGLSRDDKLGRRDVIDLCFSAIGEERKRLMRFRSATSLCRAMAALVGMSLWILTIALVSSWRLTLTATMLFGTLVVVFLAFLERARMYDGLWNAVVVPQYLALASGNTSHTVGAVSRANSSPDS